MSYATRRNKRWKLTKGRLKAMRANARKARAARRNPRPSRGARRLKTQKSRADATARRIVNDILSEEPRNEHRPRRERRLLAKLRKLKDTRAFWKHVSKHPRRNPSKQARKKSWGNRTRAEALDYLSKHHWQGFYSTDEEARKNGYAPLTSREITRLLEECAPRSNPRRKTKSKVTPSTAAARLTRWRWHRNPGKRAPKQTIYRLADGDQVTAAQLKRMFMGKIPGPAHRRLLGITKVR